jgi:phage FluMu protein Com
MEETQMIEVKVLGTGCPKCKRLEQLTYDAAAEADLDVNIEKISKRSRRIRFLARRVW